MNGMLLWFIQPFACPFYFLHSVLSAHDVCTGREKAEIHNGVSVCCPKANICGVSVIPCCADPNHS